MTDLPITLPIPLKEAGFSNGVPAVSGMPYIIGFIDLRQHPDSPHAMRGAQEHPGKPWIAVVHELPERAKRWRKYHETLQEAVDDALDCGLLTVDTAEGMAQNHRCMPGQMLVFAGIAQHPEMSLASFEPWHSAAVDNWQTVTPKLQEHPLSALAPATERPC